MYEKLLNVSIAILITTAIAGLAFPYQASSIVLALFPPAERYNIDPDGNPRMRFEPLAKFTNLISINSRLKAHSLALLKREWRSEEFGLVLETLPFIDDWNERAALFALFREQTRQSFPDEIGPWRQWYRESGYPEDNRTASLKCRLYGDHSPALKQYFNPARPARIRFDEILVGKRLPEQLHVGIARWLPAAEATGLTDESIVHGIDLPGQALACPQAVIAQCDAVQGVSGKQPLLLLYDAARQSVVCFLPNDPLRLVATGLRYQDALLVADEATGSLWSSATGEAVTGGAAPGEAAPGTSAGGQQRLEQAATRAVAWNTWRAEHPDTLVLDIRHRRGLGPPRRREIRDGGHSQAPPEP